MYMYMYLCTQRMGVDACVQDSWSILKRCGLRVSRGPLRAALDAHLGPSVQRLLYSCASPRHVLRAYMSTVLLSPTKPLPLRVF